MRTKTTLNILPLLLLTVLCNLYSHAQTPSWQWAKRVGSFNDNAPFATGDQNERFNDIKVDTLGNVYAVGEFFQNSAFNNQTMGFPTTGGYGERDAYLVKFNKCGKTLWWRRMGGTGYDRAVSLVLDGSGRVIITGNCASTFTLGGNNVQNSVLNGGGDFLARFDTAGSFINIYTVPTYNNKVFITSQGDYFISNGIQSARINTLGLTTATFTYAIVSPGIYFPPEINGIALDKNDNFYFSGRLSQPASIAGTVMVPAGTAVSPNSYWGNSLIMKFSPSGNLLWYNRSYSAVTGGDLLMYVTIDTSASIVATGGTAYSGSVVFGHTVNAISNGIANPIYFLDSNTGNLTSAITGSPSSLGAGGIFPHYTDKNNYIHCIGTVYGNSLKFNSTTYTTTTNGSSTGQMCIGKFSATGNFIDIKMLPQLNGQNISATDRINALDGDTQGNIYIAGMFGGTLDSLGTAVNKIGGSEDGFIAKFGFPCGSALTGSVPNVPLALTAVNNGSLTNNIAWTDNSNNENNFELHYTMGGNPTYTLLATLPANTTSYAHTGLTYTTTYCYKVAATNTIGSSAFSNTDCATTPAAPTNTVQAPNAPLNLTATNNGSLANTIAWTDNSSDETNFELQYTSGSSITYSLLATLPANTTTYSHTGLSYTTTYCYKVAASNTVGSSAFSNTSCATTPASPADTTSTGIAKNTASSKNVLCYPNPVSTEVYFDVPTNEKQIDIEIYNALGSLVMSKQNYANRSVLNIMDLNRGLYYYKIKTTKNEYVGKVVKE